jgi:3-oxo-5-alpha-steroid 4-dehydrogenase 3 / polyprenol reductase
LLIFAATLLSSSRTLEETTTSKLSARTIIAVILFLIGSGVQHDSHVYLASLKKYTLPERGLFQLILCPHYTGECLIYLALSIVAAPRGQMLNETISTVLMFTVVNLAITSNSTRAWYAQ